MTLPALKGGVSSFCKVWILCGFNTHTNNIFSAFETALKLPRRKAGSWVLNPLANKAIGRLGNKIGELIEHFMAADIVHKFNTLGYVFTKAGRRIIYRDHAGRFLTEVDILLENGEYALAVEVKTDISTEDIKDHVQRMAILRSYAEERRDTRRYIGAVAGGIVREPVRDYALKNGFYVIEQSGETIRIRKPEAPNQIKIW
jgi:hypothetical protein